MLIPDGHRPNIVDFVSSQTCPKSSVLLAVNWEQFTSEPCKGGQNDGFGMQHKENDKVLNRGPKLDNEGEGRRLKESEPQLVMRSEVVACIRSFLVEC